MSDAVFWWTGVVAWSALSGAIGAIIVAVIYDAVCAGIMVGIMAHMDPPSPDRSWLWIIRRTWKTFSYCWWRHPTFLIDGGREIVWPGIVQDQEDWP